MHLQTAKRRKMMKVISRIGFVALCIILSASVSLGESAQMMNTVLGNVVFEASVSGKETVYASVYKAVLKSSDPALDSEVIEYFNGIIFLQAPIKAVTESRISSTCRNYYGRVLPNEYEGEKDYVSFYDGTIGAAVYEASFYSGLMDIFSLAYDGPRYIADRLVCGDLPGMSVDETVKSFKETAEHLGFTMEENPYILRAYSMDAEALAKTGIHSYTSLNIQGNDLLAENRAAVEKYGSDCYYVAYRYELDGIPLSYEYHYIESKDYFTLPCKIYGLFNNSGLMRFAGINQYEVIETCEQGAIVPYETAAQVMADDLNLILGIEPFVCKEIALEYIPLAYSGCNLEREACLTPAWVFYFESEDHVPVMVNAMSGKIIR